MDNKEIQIISQVCAKIAADLTTKDEDTQVTADRFGILLSLVTEMVFDTIETKLSAGKTADVVQMVQKTFPNASEVTSDSQGFTVTVQGDQHGELPAWLVSACKRDGVTRVLTTVTSWLKTRSVLGSRPLVRTRLTGNRRVGHVSES